MLHQGAGPLAFYSKPFAPRHLKIAAYERELIGLVQAVRHWRPYMWGQSLHLKAIGCSSLRGGGGELGTLKTLTYGSN